MEGVYLIRDRQSGLHKIGMTTNWASRKRQLQVGQITTEIKFVQCKDSRKWERVLHSMFKHKRLPQSEWFRITEEEAIPKMNWLASQTNQQMVIGNWQRAAAGHYYRRRKSSSGRWYTEQKSAHNMRQEQETILNSRINYQETKAATDARKEPGFWPTKSDHSKIEWQQSDPTRPRFNIWIPLAILLGIFLIASLGNNSNKVKPTPRQQSKTTQRPAKYFPKSYPEASYSSKDINQRESAEIIDTSRSRSRSSSLAVEKSPKATRSLLDSEKLLDPDRITKEVKESDQENPNNKELPIYEILPIKLSGTLENICLNSTSRVLRLISQKGLEVQPATRPDPRADQRRDWSRSQNPKVYVIGLESHKSETSPAASSIAFTKDTYELSKHAREILDNCDEYSAVEFGFWSVDRWVNFAR